MANVICHANQPNNLSKAMTYKHNYFITNQYTNYSFSFPNLIVNKSYSALYDDDGVHLSFIGKDIFINTIQEALFQFLRYPNCNVYPMEHMSVD
jgi:hypothetical protein